MKRIFYVVLFVAGAALVVSFARIIVRFERACAEADGVVVHGHCVDAAAVKEIEGRR